MTYHQIFAAGLRVLALWLGLTTISYMAALPISEGAHMKADRREKRGQARLEMLREVRVRSF